MNQQGPPTVAVIGGGITGLAAAHRLRELRPSWPVVLLEASSRLGGVLQTERQGEFLIEHAADNFLHGPSAPWAEHLVTRLGMADQLVETNSQHRGAHVFWHGRQIPIPEGFQLMAPSRLLPMMTTPLLSPVGKLRLLAEPFIRPANSETDVCLTEFAVRRLGRETFERLVQPLVAGIYTADPDRLSVKSALPQMEQMVRQHGSLYRAMRHRSRTNSQVADTSRGARYSLFVAPRDGMSSLIEKLAEATRSADIRLNTPADSLRRDANGHWHITLAHKHEPLTCDGVVVALPANRAASLVASADDKLAEELSGIDFASSAVVCLGYPRSQIGAPLNAFGCVVPAVQKRRVLAISYSSVKFQGRAPEDCHLLRVFVGGALQPELLEQDDPQLVDMVRSELREMLRIEGPPRVATVVRWPQAMPQYHVGHSKRLQRIDQRLSKLPGLQLAGNSYEGVGMPQCVRSGEAAAEQLIDQLQCEEP